MSEHAGHAIGNYTAQINRDGNIVVFKGSDARPGFRIVFRGGHHACLRYKVAEYITKQPEFV